jgi:phosphopantothenoylcysteine decarboxylase/phosphopantothenate--cysteine ligase
MARLLLGVSGGIAAYKALELTRLAIRAGHAVRVIQTEASLQFVGKASFEGITGAPVLSDEFEADPSRGAYPGEPVPERAPISHLGLAERAELYLIAPASANTIAKLAHGHADNLLSAAALAAACPVAVAPAMNNRMYLHPATRANLEALAARGVTVIPSGDGELASHGEHGVGRLPEPAELLAVVERLLRGAGARSWSGVRVLVTAGGTREPIDSVRFIGNRSSGRMGVALAAEAARRGAEVTLVAANLSLPTPAGVGVVAVETAAQLKAACEERFDACDVLLMAAAVADFRPAAPAATKLKKDAGPPGPLELEATDDVLSGLAARKRPGQRLVGFAAEHGERAVASGRAKLKRKHLDLVVVNDISRSDIGFDADQNEVVIVSTRGERPVLRSSKQRIAAGVLDEVERLSSERGVADGTGRADAGRVARV